MKGLHWSKLSLMTTVMMATTFAFSLSISPVGLYVAHAARASSSHAHINCATGDPRCAELADPEAAFGEGHYVGHDEPSTLFYSNAHGSGNRVRYQLRLPKDPSPTAPMTPGKSYNFELHPAFWLGMAMCATESYPEQVSTCTPDSDKNIVDPAISPNHPGQAYTELQFYPPGWADTSCDATRWCVALNVWSLAEDPVHGLILNSSCAAITAVENDNFAFITKTGVPQPNSPPNPVQSTITTFTPNPAVDLFMNSGDQLAVTMHDTAHGLQVVINDETTGQTGSMTASAANGFGQVKFAPPPSTDCINIPYDFHPMYSTSSEKTRVTWTAHTYNIALADEIGHFDFCSAVDTSNGTCTGLEGIAGDQEPSDADDLVCLPASASLLVQVSGCIGENDPGFDGISYQPLWPDGNTKLHPTPIQFSSPLTGGDYNVNYSRVAFEADLPAIEFTTCKRATGAGCTLIPPTDEGLPAVFYPFFSIGQTEGNCMWRLGNHIPGSRNDFGQNAEYGTLLNLTYTRFGGGGAPLTVYEDFRNILSHNPCPV